LGGHQLICGQSCKIYILSEYRMQDCYTLQIYVSIGGTFMNIQTKLNFALNLKEVFVSTSEHFSTLDVSNRGQDE
jgi:hypothetical protein